VIPPGLPDTLRFRFLPNGDIEQYGFFARAAQRRRDAAPEPRWDRIGAFSLPVNGVWTAGVLDSAGQCVRLADLDRDGRLDLILSETVTSTDPNVPGGWEIYLNRK
jgi:hypothetical protein